MPAFASASGCARTATRSKATGRWTPRAACIRTRGACGARPPTSTRSARRRAPTFGSACKRWGIDRIIRLPSFREPMRLSWRDLGTPRADRAHGKTVEIVGWPATALPTKAADYFLPTSEPNCCAGCLPANPQAVLEVFADRALEFAGRSMRLSGTLVVLEDDPVGWRYQLRGACATGGITRRKLLAASPLVCLPVPAMAQASGPTVDIHSHGGNVIQRYSQSDYQFAPLAEPMRQGGMAGICLPAVSGSPTILPTGGPPPPCREGRPGRIYAPHPTGPPS